MIIRFPTGLYAQTGQIPTDDSQTGNLTFTISTLDPKRSRERFLRLPIAEAIRLPDAQISLTFDERQAALGDLLFTVTMGSVLDSGSNRKLFGIGEILEFDDITFESPDAELPTQLNLSHNTNIIDLADLGLTDKQIDNLNRDVVEKNEELLIQYNLSQSVIDDIKVQLSENQKRLNETNKTISVLADILEEDDGALETLRANKIILETEQVDLRSQQQTLIDQSLVIMQQIVRLSEFVK